eukprot:6491067-Amphidinium_carterae.1
MAKSLAGESTRAKLPSAKAKSKAKASGASGGDKPKVVKLVAGLREKYMPQKNMQCLVGFACLIKLQGVLRKQASLVAFWLFSSYFTSELISTGQNLGSLQG